MVLKPRRVRKAGGQEGGFTPSPTSAPSSAIDQACTLGQSNDEEGRVGTRVSTTSAIAMGGAIYDQGPRCNIACRRLTAKGGVLVQNSLDQESTISEIVQRLMAPFIDEAG